MTAETLRQIIETDEYEVYGLRAHRGDEPEIGATIPNSYIWDDGEQTDEELPGVSTVKVTAETIDQVIEDIRAVYAWDDAPVVLVGGHNYQWGTDTDELIIRDGVCLAIMA